MSSNSDFGKESMLVYLWVTCSKWPWIGPLTSWYSGGGGADIAVPGTRVCMQELNELTM